jgi:hypothetical protein
MEILVLNDGRATAPLRSINSLVWNVLMDRPDVNDQTDGAILDQLTSASAVRIILAGNLLQSLPNSGTTYGAYSYGINEVGVYGR